MMATCILKFPKHGSWVNPLLDTYPRTINRVACLLWGTLPLSHKAINGVKTISKWEAKGELLPLIAGINQTKRESFVFRSWSLSDPPTAVPCFFCIHWLVLSVKQRLILGNLSRLGGNARPIQRIVLNRKYTSDTRPIQRINLIRMCLTNL